MKNILSQKPILLSSTIKPSRGNLSSLSGQRLSTAKPSFVTRNVPIGEYRYLITNNKKPNAGDLILARVDKLGQHQRIELPNGRRAHLFPGDEIIVSYANRYAPDQFLGLVPEKLEPCSLVAAGGIASIVTAKHSSMKKATSITPLGFLASHNKKIINLSDYQLPVTSSSNVRPKILVVAGSSMNGGKTTTVAFLIRGLIKAGLSVASAKITGTGSGPDFWKMKDAGAYPVIDFTDMGLASTYKVNAEQIQSVMERQINYLSAHKVDVILLEIADGLAQTETAALMKHPRFRSSIDGLFFAAAEALSVQTAVNWIKSYELPLLGVSGALTASPMALEEVRQQCPVPVFTKDELGSSMFYPQLLELMGKENHSILSVQ